MHRIALKNQSLLLHASLLTFPFPNSYFCCREHKTGCKQEVEIPESLRGRSNLYCQKCVLICLRSEFAQWHSLVGVYLGLDFMYGSALANYYHLLSHNITRKHAMQLARPEDLVQTQQAN